jgi:hypothetical protein
MKKNIYLTIIGLFAFTASNAQITITAPPASAANYNDTFGQPSNFADFKAYADAKTNAKWDFSIAQYPDNGYHSLRTTLSSTNYPTSKFNFIATYTFAGALGYSALQHYDMSSASIASIGEEVTVEQVLPLGSITGNANDELVFPVQNVVYSEPQIDRKYPVTIGSSFTSTNTKNTKFNLTVTAYGLNNTPGVRKSVRTVKDTVIGWGTVKIKGAFYKRIYDNVPVLQVRRTVTVTDSFFLNGSPAPQQLLDAFGLKQGVPENFYYIDFINQGELDELIRIDFDKSAFVTVKEVEIQENRLEQYIITGLTDLAVQNAINVYPNPIAGNTITVDLPTNQSGSWTYKLKDILGREVSKGVINTNTISLPNEFTNGTYILTISNNNNVVSVNKVIK